MNAKKQLHDFDVDYLVGTVRHNRRSPEAKLEKDKKKSLSIYISDTFVFLIDLLVSEGKYQNRSLFFTEAFYDVFTEYQELMNLKGLFEIKLRELTGWTKLK